MSDQKESLDVNAKSIEEAIEQGLTQLGLARDQVNIEIINEGKRGLFGLGSEDAVVRLTPKNQPQTTVDLQAASNNTPEPPDVLSEPATETTSDQPETSIEPPADDRPQSVDISDEQPDENTIEKIGTAYLSDLLKLMGVQAQVQTRLATDLVEPGEDAPLVFDVVGKDLGILIGRHNETLQALQYMLRLMISKETGQWQPVVVDVESYRARRRDSLRKLALRMAERAAVNNERVVMEAMPAYERRIIHITLRDHPDVITKSIGHDRSRKVTIIPK